MTAKQILDAFSETLMRDDRILNSRERELLTSLLQKSRAASSSNPETQSAVNAAIARSVGETVAQRAFALLGGSIVEQILARSEISATNDETVRARTIQFSPAPVPPPPSPGPQPPSVRQPPKPEPPSRRTPDKSPAPVQPPSPPQPPSHGLQPLTASQSSQGRQFGSDGNVGVLDAPSVVRAQCVVLDEFLAPQELDELFAYTLQNEAAFQSSEVISPGGDPGAIDCHHRRSHVLMDLGNHENIILERIRCVLSKVLDQLGMKEFTITRTEAQITASNDGDFFGAHSDDAHETIASRHLTFVYFFHREPCPFAGGELHLHDSHQDGEQYAGPSNHTPVSYQTIVPQPNRIVFFPCSTLHEIRPVNCPSRAFADSRFTLNGWLHN
jgi:Rps23 Pro-64 3,4-dihydroxylase Tpa1-like proline 4-hydroxylase